MIVQELGIIYSKETRGGRFDRFRYNFEYPLPENLFDCPEWYNEKKTKDLYVHSSFTHHRGFDIYFNKTSLLKPRTNDKIKAFNWGFITDDFKVIYKYNTNMGLPAKLIQQDIYQGKNSIPLEETAFQLMTGEWGQIMYNGRIQTFENVYYIFFKCNIVNNTIPVDKNYFISNKPDKIYRQISRMF